MSPRSRPAHSVIIFLLCAIIAISLIQLSVFLWFQSTTDSSQSLDPIPFSLTSSSFSFPAPPNWKQLRFEITANGARANGSLRGYCDPVTRTCTIPLVFGGNQTISILQNNNVQFSQSIQSSENRFYCFNGGWERRICRFRDICFDNNNLTFLSPYPIESSVPFLVLGGRSPPYDRKRDRIYSLKVNVSEAIPTGRKVHEETTFYVSTYYNMQMLWHALFDFALPLFHTISLFQLDKPPAVIIPKDADKPKLDVVRPFTSSFGRLKNTHCYRDLIVGMSKVKDAETGKLYDFPKNFTHLLMPSILDYFNISEGLPSKPVILVIGRHTSSRVFTNFEEVIEMLVTGFPAFEVKRIYFEDVQMKQQIEAAYKATIMIGVHGSGLSHVAWMRAGTTMIEILPYKFNCRDWYEKATFFCFSIV
jgi:hypothetical protein